jgi:hypothetical protein
MRKQAGVVLAMALAASLAMPAALAGDQTVVFETNPLASFRVGHPEQMRFGRLTYAGGLVIDSKKGLVGGLSGLLIFGNGASLLAISDDGLMLKADIERNAGRPVGLSGGVLRPMQGITKRQINAKWNVDSESIDVAQTAEGARATISLEGRPRVMTGLFGDDDFVGPLTDIPLPDLTATLRFTKGLEAVAVGPAGTRLEGATIVIAERAEQNAATSDQPGWIIGGSEPGRFRVKFRDGYDVTDAKFAPDGDLYILERLYSFAAGVRTRLRRIPAETIADGATLDGEIVFEATLADQIDNMEGLAFWTNASGQTMISLISDDNRSFLQRTLYLEFMLDR